MMSAVNASSSGRLCGFLRWVERCWPRTLQAKRSETENFATKWATQRRRREGLRSSRGCVFQDQLLQRQIRHRLAQPVILFLEFLQPLHLIAFEATELLAPAVIRELRHADRANRFANRFSLRQQNIDLAQLRDDLFRLVLLLGHYNVLSQAQEPTSGRTTFQGADQKVP